MAMLLMLTWLGQRRRVAGAGWPHLEDVISGEMTAMLLQVCIRIVPAAFRVCAAVAYAACRVNPSD
jgi:hypothetical protein